MAGGEANSVLRLKSSLPTTDGIWSLITQKVKEAISEVGDFCTSAWKKAKEFPVVIKVVDFVEEETSAVIPYVKKATDYSVEKIKQHPYLAGLIAIFTVWFIFRKYCRSCRRGRRGGKMMKAPGADYMMLRSQFESSPRSYFQGLRGKGVIDASEYV